MANNETIKVKSNFLRGTLAKELENQLTGSICDDDQQLIKFHGIYQQDDRDRRALRAEKKLEKDYSFMIRLRIPGGRISAEQWLNIDEVANSNATGVIKITTRQTVQLHGVVKSKLKPTVQDFAKFNLDSIAACGDVNRNVIATSTPDLSKAHLEVYEYSKKISEYLLPETRAYQEIWLDGEKIGEEKAETEPLYSEIYLPRKFKIALALPPHNDVDVYAHDIGLIAIIENDELIGFNLVIGGGMGMTHGNEKTYPRVGDLVGFVPKEKILDICYQIITVQRDYGNREDRKNARFKYTIDRLGLDFIKKEIEKRAGFELEDAREFTFQYRGDIFNWQKDYQNKWNYTLFVENGRVLGAQKQAFLEIAKEGLADFRFSNNQNVTLTNISERDKVRAIIEKYNLDNQQSQIRHNAMACVALNTCPLALAEGQRYLPELIDKIEPILSKHQLEREAISIRMTGCPNGCARPYLAEIGFVGKAAGKYNMYLGAKSLGLGLNKLYKEDLVEEEILKELDLLFARYSAEKESNEAFGNFVLRQQIV